MSKRYLPPYFRNLRHAAAKRQQRRCYYCDGPMWIGTPHAFMREHDLAEDRSALFQCTAEHLTPFSEGGASNARNIVAACRYCNQSRHQRFAALSVVQYRAHVRDQIAKGAWETGPLKVAASGPDPRFRSRSTTG